MISPRPGIQQFAVAVAVAQRPSSVPGGSKAASGSGVHASRRRATSAVVSLTDDTLRIALGGDGAAQVEGRILVGGDVCPNDALERSFSGQAARAFWGDVGDAVREHDVAVCNLECPLTRRGTQIPKIGPHLRADPLCAHGVRAGGFGVASLANNHILDMGAEGVQDTLAACAEAGLQTVGAGVTLEAARQPLIARLGSTSVALVAVCEREFSIATETSPGAAPLDAVETFRQIRVARAEADVIIAIVHGGNEHYALPSPWLLETCRFLAEAGASAVICHHSHVASGFEVFDGVPIVYGTGNLAFWAPDRAEAWYHGYLASVSVAAGRVTGVELIPYQQCRGAAQARRLTGARARAFLDGIAARSATIENAHAFQAEWAAFCAAQRSWYMARLAAISRVDQVLWQRRLLPQSLLRRRAANWLGLLGSPSHLAVLLGALDELMRGRRT